MKRTPSPYLVRSLRVFPALPFALAAIGLGAQTIAPPPSAPQAAPTASTAQSPAQSPRAQQTAQVEPTQLAAELTKGISTKKAKTGDEIEAKTTIDASLPNGTKIPKGTKLVGNVVEVTAKSKEQKNSHLVFSLNRAVMKDGHDVPIHAAVTSVSAPVMMQSADAPMPAGSSPGGAPESSASAAGGSQMNTAGPASNAPTMAASSSNDQPQQVAVLKSAQDRVPVAGLPSVILSAPTTPQSAGVLDAQNENFSLESGTKFIVNVTPAQEGL
jgi:hypothetical protein